MNILQSNKKANDIRYYPSLDGLRAIAVTLVFLHHFNSTVFSLGWIGVNLFFVLSGFLITTVILNSVTQPNFFKNFYIRRTLRIFPLYYLAIIIFLIILPYWSSKEIYISSKETFWYFFFYVQNVYISIKGANAGYLGHFWTLAVEEQFYILWPLIVFLNYKNTKRLIVVTLIGISTAIILREYLIFTQVSKLFVNVFTFTNVDSLLLGSLLAILHHTKNADWIIKRMKYAVLLSVVFFSLFLVSYSFGYLEAFKGTFLSVSFGSFIFYLFYHDETNTPTIISNLFMNKILQNIGKWSYGFYVWHYPIILICMPKAHLVLNFLPPLIKESVLCFMLFLITTFVSALSYNYFEKYFLKLKSKFEYKPDAA